MSPGTDKGYSFTEALAHCASPLDGKAAEKPSKAKSINEQEILADRAQLELSNLQMQIDGEKKRHKARMMELETERVAKLRLIEGRHLADTHPSYTSIEARMRWETKNGKDPQQDSPSMYSMPQPSPFSDATTLVEPGDTSSVEGPVNPTSSDVELDNDTAIYQAWYPVKELTKNVCKEEGSAEALVKHLVAHRLDEESAHGDDFPNTKSLSKRKRLSGYLSLKKQRLAATTTIGHGRQDGIDETPVSRSKKPDSNLASPPEGPTETGMARISKSTDHVQLDHKQEDLGNTNTTRKAHSLGQALKNRPSRILVGRAFAVQGKKVACTETVSQLLITDSHRPISWPRSRRWRKSFGVSVKALTDGFERLAMA